MRIDRHPTESRFRKFVSERTAPSGPVIEMTLPRIALRFASLHPGLKMVRSHRDP